MSLPRMASFFPAPLLNYHRITAGLIRNLLFDLVRGQAGYIQTVYGSIGKVYPLVFLSHSHINSASSNSRRQDCSPDCYGNFSAGVLFFLFFRSFLFRIQKIQMFPLLFLLFFSLLLSAPLSAAAAIAFPLISVSISFLFLLSIISLGAIRPFHLPDGCCFCLVIADYRNPCVHQVIKGCCLGRRQIDTAMASAGLINRSAKLTAPVCIVKTDSAIERHPVRYRRFIFILAVCLLLPAQDAVTLLVGKAVKVPAVLCNSWRHFRSHKAHPRLQRHPLSYRHAAR